MNVCFLLQRLSELSSHCLPCPAGLQSLTLDVDVGCSKAAKYDFEATMPDNSGLLHAISCLTSLTELELPSELALQDVGKLFSHSAPCVWHLLPKLFVGGSRSAQATAACGALLYPSIRND